ncbi:uncharacterized protein PFL1_06047 [Pseudozyma flocculosa PF-1]|nr:uncharacterized protein PFL1_06047 [Pseudozyma flocculosa PF-1]EPQ26399.1 hypothetical protein PFL1_06047 [Pseudozyma flocculosa PF-1]
MANSYTTQIEIWNEPDLGTTFWGRSQDQYLEMYLRGVRAFRAAFGKGSAAYLPIVGPSTAGRPESTNAWIAKWLSTLQSNKDATPDIYNWHLEGNDRNDPVVSTGYLRGRLSELGLSAGIGFQNNEYGVRSQQKPGYGAWFAARFEKVKHNGMRGNWASGNLLRDNLADLLLKDGQGAYHTTGEYQEWKTYAGLEGAPCGTTTGSSVDSYAVSSSGARSASALVGNAGFTGSANVVFAKVSSLAKDAKRYQAKVERIPYNGGKEVTGLTAVSTSTVDVANDRISVPIDYADADDAYLVTITAA